MLICCLTIMTTKYEWYEEEYQEGRETEPEGKSVEISPALWVPWTDKLWSPHLSLRKKSLKSKERVGMNAGLLYWDVSTLRETREILPWGLGKYYEQAWDKLHILSPGILNWMRSKLPMKGSVLMAPLKILPKPKTHQIMITRSQKRKT